MIPRRFPPLAAFTFMHESRPDYHGLQQYTSNLFSGYFFRPFLAKSTTNSPVSYPPRPAPRTMMISTHPSTLPPYFLHLSWPQATPTSPTPHLTRAYGPNSTEPHCHQLPRAQLQPRKHLPPALARSTSTSTKVATPKAPTCLRM